MSTGKCDYCGRESVETKRSWRGDNECDRCHTIAWICGTSVYDGRNTIGNCSDVETLQIALVRERQDRRRRGIIVALERRIRKLEKAGRKQT